METQEFLTPELVSGLVSGVMVVVALFFGRGVAWLKSLVMGTPTKLDDKVYNALTNAFKDAGVITEAQAAARAVEKPKPGGLKLQAAPLATLGAVALLGLVLTGCGLTPQGDFVRQTVATQGAAAYDEGLGNAEWFICNAASVGSIKRRYGRSQSTADAWNELCDGEDDVEILQPAE